MCVFLGVMSVLSKIRANNDLGHPLCGNLRSGNWLCEYTSNRLLAHEGTRALGKWLARVLGEIGKMPRYLIPCYFDAVITGVFMLVEEVCWAKLGQ